MSRSYKKEPISKDNQRGGAKWGKRMAASRIRNIDPESEEAEVLAGKSNRYKKINRDTYDIHDYVSRWTEDEARKAFENESNPDSPYSWHSRYGTVENFLNKVWAKNCKRK